MKQFTFNVDSALLSELGERLVPSVHVALTELVKNAYDADATKVEVSVSYDSAGSPQILVADNGSGMTLRDVRSFWMKIGTTNKVNTRSSRYGRWRTGAKGIGRFCCRRLGPHLELTTCALIPKNKLSESDLINGIKYEVTTITFDWKKFSPGIDVSSVVSLGNSRKQSKGKTGTTLKIWGAEIDEWSQRGFDFIRRQLAILVGNEGAKRAGYKEDPGFSVVLNSPDFRGGEGDLRDQIIEASWGTLTAYIDAAGRAHYTLTSKGSKTQKITSKVIYTELHDASLKIGIVPDGKGRVHFRDPSILTRYVAGELSEWGGIKVKFNGFRIYPYGDPNDDWLAIDRDRGKRLGRPDPERDDGDLIDFAKSLPNVDPGRVLLSLLSSESYVGTVEVDSEQTTLEPKADRLGFVDNKALDELRRFVRYGVDWSTILRDQYLQSLEEDRVEWGREQMQAVLNREVPPEEIAKSAVTYLRTELGRLTRFLPHEEQKKTQHLLSLTTKALEASVEGDQQKLRRLRLIASASTLTLLFAHEIKSLLGMVDTVGSALKQISKVVTNDRDKNRIINLGQSIASTHQRFTDLIELTSIVGTMGKSASTARINLHSVIERSVQCFSIICKNYGIGVHYSQVPRGIMIGPMLQGEIFAITLNVLSNAIKSVIAEGGTRLVEFSATESNGKVTLELRDTGVGLQEKDYDAVFTSFISDPSGVLYDKLEEKLNPQDRTIFGEGSGLGLSIVRDIVRSRRGRVQFVKPSGGWNACIQIQL